MNAKEIAARKSRQYMASQSKAKKYVKDAKRLKKLYDEVSAKADEVGDGPFGATWRYLKAMLRLISSYANGSYRKVPTASLVMIVTAAIYFLSPIDVIPDFIPVVGYIDDALIVAFTVAAVKEDLNRFLAWERTV